MPYLVNKAKKSLIETIGKQIENAAEKNKGMDFFFFSITCYLDINALAKLANIVKEKTEKHKAKLSGFYVFVDIGDWIKSKRSIKSIENEIRELLSIRRVNLYPINYSGQLFHAKSYCFVSNNKEVKEGFIISTSGNLTLRGLGLKAYGNNIEIYQLTKSKKALKSFVNLVSKLKTKRVDPIKVEKQDRFLLALRIFSKGSFYHKWEGNISSEVIFSLPLTKLGSEKMSGNAPEEFENYKPNSKTMSRDPLKLSDIFKKKPKPFPKRFWATYSVDTLFGRWVPTGISRIIDRELKKGAEPYIKKIKLWASDKKIESIKEELIIEGSRLIDLKYIKVNDASEFVDLWVNKVKKFRDNEDLIKSKIFNYDKLPDILDSSNRTSIQKSYNRTIEQGNMGKQLQGLKKVVFDELIAPQRKAYNTKIKSMVEKAKNDIKKHASKKKANKKMHPTGSHARFLDIIPISFYA